jgi:hypothetical protein
VTYRFIAHTVVCSLLVPLFNAAFAAAADGPPSKSTDEERFISELFRLELLPRLNPGETCKMFSSYDTTGGNDDGFSGKYSVLRDENGASVLAEMKGPGCIQRMHFPHSEYGVPGLLGRKGEHVRIYLDGAEKPALDVPLEDIFYGKVDGFPKPISDTAIGGFYCYVPIPYKESCKVVVASKAVRFVQIVYRTFPSDRGIATFQNPPTASQRAALTKAVKAWTSCGDLAALGVDESSKVEKPFALEAGQSLDWTLPEGPKMLRALRLTIKPEQLANAAAARLQITWDDAKSPAVDVPLEYFFCQAADPIAFRSLLLGSSDQGWYNFMPMPYRTSGKLTLKAGKPLAGTLSVVTEPLPADADNLGYLHVAYNESLPTKKGMFHPYLLRQGRGRFIGVYLVTDGHNDSNMPTWLEGDEWFTCDGEMRIHGTGTEDSFNGGWYAVPGRLNGPGTTPISGFPVYRKRAGREKAVAFRWYLTDPISYDKSIDAKLEHGPTNDINANYRTAAFYYDAAP